jgi:hypothetical protein
MKPFLLFLPFILGGTAIYGQWHELNPPVVFFNNTINAVTADMAGRVYAAGKCTDGSNNYIVGVLSNGAWAEVGAGNALHASKVINTLTVDSSGNLYAGGAFTDSSGNYYVAKWNGSQWSEPGGGAPAIFTGQTIALAADKAGNIYAGGELIDSNGHYYIAKWDGRSWSEVGTGSQALNANGIIYSITCDADGNIYTAGHFTDTAGHYYVAKWNGIQWVETGSGAGALNANSYITSITVDGGGSMYAAGDFKDPAGYQYVAGWNGSSWSELGTGGSALKANGTINALVIDASGRIDAGGWFTDSTEFYSIERWSGSSWTEAPPGGGVWPANGDITSLAADRNGNLYATGNSQDANQNYFVAELSGFSWTETGTKATNFPPVAVDVPVVAVDTASHVMALVGPGAGAEMTGEYWNQGAWFTLPPDSFFQAATISQLVPDSAGNIYACGVFAGAMGVAKWDGVRWALLPAIGSQFLVAGFTYMAVDKKGNVYLCCNNTTGNPAQILEWNGSAWQTYVILEQSLYYFVVDATGTIYGAYDDNGFHKYNVVRITPGGSTPLTGGTQKMALNFNTLVHSMAFDAAGNLYIGGEFTDSTGNIYIAKWDGTNWTKLGSDLSTFGNWGAVDELVFDNAGNLYCAGYLPNGVAGGVGKWNGQSWINTGSPVDDQSIMLERDAHGNIYVAGFTYGSKGNGTYVFEYDNANQPLPAACSSTVAIAQLIASPDTATGSSGPITVTAGVVSGDGTGTIFVFSRDRNFDTVLQSSGDSVLTLSPDSLPAGLSKIYVKVQTINACDSSITALDSISVFDQATGITSTGNDTSSVIAGPNPFISFIDVDGLSTAKSYSIFLYDGQGAKAWATQVNGVTRAQLTGPALKQGIYWLEVFDNSSGQRVSKKTVVRMQ